VERGHAALEVLGFDALWRITIGDRLRDSCEDHRGAADSRVRQTKDGGIRV
jgi:hypothetical protein